MVWKHSFGSKNTAFCKSKHLIPDPNYKTQNPCVAKKTHSQTKDPWHQGPQGALFKTLKQPCNGFKVLCLGQNVFQTVTKEQPERV